MEDESMKHAASKELSPCYTQAYVIHSTRTRDLYAVLENMSFSVEIFA